MRISLPRPCSAAFALFSVLLLPGPVVNAAEAPPRDPVVLVTTICAACHGVTLTGGAGPNLLDTYWNHGGDAASIARSIRDGWWLSRMPPFKAVLTEAEIAGLVTYIQHQGEEFAQGRVTLPPRAPDQTIQSERQTFRLETVVSNLEIPWGIAFIPGDRMIVTERPGRLRLIEDGKLQAEPIRGTPKAFFRQDGGMLDVIAHPNYAKNGWLYLAYSEEGQVPDTSMTVVVRGRIREGSWVDQQEIFRASPEKYYRGYVHYGCRFLFDREGHLFFTLGDRGHSNEAQDLGSPLGKIHRVMDDGRIPPDNPFVGRAGALGSIWSYGHRHPQGLMWHPVTGKLWETEHGPTGGDELNRIEPGHNYGWPIISDGTDLEIKIQGRAHEGMERPITSWTPTLAPSGIEFYAGDRFPAWKNNLFIASLLQEKLLRLEIEGEKVTHEETIFHGIGRVRDVTTGPDGLLYVAVEGPGRILRLVPTETPDGRTPGSAASATK
jgi:glucose/arabinose dehydrogenase